MKRKMILGIAAAVALFGAVGAASAAQLQPPDTSRRVQPVSQMRQPADSSACQSVDGRSPLKNLRWQDDARTGTFSAFVAELERRFSGLFEGAMGGAAMGGGMGSALMGNGMMGGAAMGGGKVGGALVGGAMMDWLTNSWWLWLGVVALLSWAYARYRHAPVSWHAHADVGAHGETQVANRAHTQRVHAGHGGGGGGGHAKH